MFLYIISRSGVNIQGVNIGVNIGGGNVLVGLNTTKSGWYMCYRFSFCLVNYIECFHLSKTTYFNFLSYCSFICFCFAPALVFIDNHAQFCNFELIL